MGLLLLCLYPHFHSSVRSITTSKKFKLGFKFCRSFFPLLHSRMEIGESTSHPDKWGNSIILFIGKSFLSEPHKQEEKNIGQDEAKQGEGAQMADDCSLPPFTDCHLSKDKRRVLVVSTEFSAWKQCLQSYHSSVCILCNVFFGCIYVYGWPGYGCAVGVNTLFSQAAQPSLETIYQTVKKVLQYRSIYHILTLHGHDISNC